MPSLAVLAFIKLFTGWLAKTAGGGGNVVSNCAGCDIVTPVAVFVTYIGLVAYIAFGRAKSICNGGEERKGIRIMHMSSANGRKGEMENGECVDCIVSLKKKYHWQAIINYFKWILNQFIWKILFNIIKYTFEWIKILIPIAIHAGKKIPTVSHQAWWLFIS